jgi:hypothetical protein
MNVAQAERLQKDRHPHLYCRARGCLWHVGRSGPCPRHPNAVGGTAAEAEALYGGVKSALGKGEIESRIGDSRE